MEKKYFALIMILICTFLTALGQIVWKIAMNKLSLNLLLLTNHMIWAGFGLYCAGAIFMIWALRYGNLSFVHPFISLSFVWVILLAFFYLNESFNLLKIISIVFIVLGIFFIFRGDSQ